MELSQLFDRVIRPHAILIGVAILISMGVAFLLHGNTGSVYTASARVVLDTPDPQSRAESTAIADTARAISTSPAPVRKALLRAGVRGRDPIEVASHDVSVDALGSSGVLQLSVADRDPVVAAKIANALAEELIETRLAVTSGEVDQALARFDNLIGGLSRRIAALDTSIDQLTVDVANATGTRASVLQANRLEAARSRDFLAQQRAALESERVGLLSNAAARPKPTVISQATPPATRDPSGLIPVLALGGVLGLVLGVAVAGLLESVRPTLHGGGAIAKELHVPLLGRLPYKPVTPPTLQGLDHIGGQLRLAADAAGVNKVGVIGRPELDVAGLAKRLELAASGVSQSGGTLGGASTPRRATLGSETNMPTTNGHLPVTELKVVPFSAGTTRDDNGHVGLVLVAPETMQRDELADVEHLVGGAGKARLVGVIAYARSKGPKASAVDAGEQR